MTNRCSPNNKIKCKLFLCFRLEQIQVKLTSSCKLLKLLHFFLEISVIFSISTDDSKKEVILVPLGKVSVIMVALH